MLKLKLKLKLKRGIYWAAIISVLLQTNIAFSTDVLLKEKFSGSQAQIDIVQNSSKHSNLVNNKKKTLIKAVEGFEGLGIKLDPSYHYTLQLQEPISASGGTLSFWVKPSWLQPRESSQTLLSLRWDHPKQSYMAISMGWWEPIGKRRLYFILSNEEFMHCSIERELEVDEWTMVTAVWANGNSGYCKLFLDGEKVAQHSNKYNGTYKSSKTLFIGSDLGATDQRDRTAHAIFDELTILNNSLSENSVSTLFLNETTNNKYLRSKKHRWIDNILSDEQKSDNNDLLSPISERRAIFDESIDWALSRKNTDLIVKRIVRAGFNIYIPCVWHGRGTYYRSELSHQHPKVTKRIKQGDDPLKYLIDRAHSYGVEVHPWFTVVRREDEKYPQFYEDGVPDLAYDVHNPKFSKFISNLIVDVVSRYSVDGINLDYIRSMGICKSKACKAEYENIYKRNLLADVMLRKIPGKKIESIRQWNGSAINKIVEEISKRTREVKENIIISVDAHPLNPDLLDQGQDSIFWANNGWIDVIYKMDYKKRIDIDIAKRIKEQLIEEEKLRFLLALYDIIDEKPVSREGELIADYIRIARKVLPNSGIGFYHYPRLSDEQIEITSSSVFKGQGISQHLKKESRNGE